MRLIVPLETNPEGPGMLSQDGEQGVLTFRSTQTMDITGDRWHSRSSQVI